MKKILFFILVSLLGVPYTVHAARIYFSPAQAVLPVGNRQVINVFLDTEKASVNAVNLIIRYPKLIGISDLSRRGSLFSLWVQEPSFTGDSILLSGGVPGGATTDHGLIAQFTMQGRAIGEGSIALDPSSVVLLNDGIGTAAPLKTNPLTVRVTARLPGISPLGVTPTETPVQKEDGRRPKRFSIAIASDPGVFGGNYFASFFTSDSESGVARYELREASGSFQIAKSPYLLLDQERHSVIRVRAYDAAGNWRESIWPGFFKRTWWWITGLF